MSWRVEWEVVCLFFFVEGQVDNRIVQLCIRRQRQMVKRDRVWAGLRVRESVLLLRPATPHCANMQVWGGCIHAQNNTTELQYRRGVLRLSVKLA